MANMDDIVKQQQEDRAKGTLELREERDAFRMTLRDQFAMNCPFTLADAVEIYRGGNKPVTDVCAEVAYIYADSMLKARRIENE